MNCQYTIVIQWSDEDQKYLVSLPEFGPYAHTHGNSYEEACKNGQEVLELLIEDYQARNKPLPKRTFEKSEAMAESIILSLGTSP